MKKSYSNLDWQVFIKGSISILLICLLPGCEDQTAQEPNPNIRPETYISSIDPGVTTLVSWYATDVDGVVNRFKYKWDDGEWIETTEMTVSFPVSDPSNSYSNFEFEDFESQRTFFVAAIDNANQEDLSPAMVTASPRTTKPETQILESPPFGGVTGTDIYFQWSGVDQDGTVTGFEYTMDDLSEWIYTQAIFEDGLATGEMQYLGLGAGSHIFYVRAIDNYGIRDESPSQVPFVVKPGDVPVLTSTSPVVDGGGWFAGVDLTLSWMVDVEYYYGQLPFGFATFSLDDSTGYGDDLADMQYNWRSATSFKVSGDNLTPGEHTFYVKARDTQNKVSKFKISFSAAAYEPDKDLLIVNGVSEADYDEIPGMYDDSVYWGGLDLTKVYFWDVMGSSSTPSVSSMPTDNYLGGGGPVTPDVLAQFKAVVWVGNNYNGDFEHWETTPVYPYLLTGGNMLLLSRLGSSFIDGALLDYVQISWREEETTLAEAKPVFPGMTEIVMEGNMSLASNFSTGGFNSGGGLSEDDVDGFAGARSFTKPSGTATMLFAHRPDDNNGGGVFVRGTGVWTHPNLDYSDDLEQFTLPQVGTDETKGNFVFISGRHYRMDHTTLKVNVKKIIQDFFRLLD